jgi:3-oxoacyl-[acyl-carrier-protein] synthase-3
MKKAWHEKDLIDLIERIVAREIRRGLAVPDIEVDLVKAGLVDSMGWVGILSGLEEATGITNFGSTWPEGKAQSISSLLEAVRATLAGPGLASAASSENRASDANPQEISIAGWGCTLGSLRVEAAQVEKECGLAAGTIRDRAGIRSVCRADQNENEVFLAQKAAKLALQAADLETDDLDLLVCTSATFLELPSLGPALHSRLLLREWCPALDVGGACVGLVNGLAVAKGLLTNGGLRAALVVASEVHSRRLVSPEVPGEFRGLFGDGACAFVVSPSGSRQRNAGSRVGGFAWGCSGALSSSLQVGLRLTGELHVDFNGESLASGAVTTLNRVIGKLEDLSSVARSEVECFAFHEPNPRLTVVLAQRANIQLQRIAQTAETSGNLGSVTCGVNLCAALTRLRENPNAPGRRVIFVATVGPGLLWGGAYFD